MVDVFDTAEPEVFENDSKIVVESADGRHVYRKVDGELEYLLEESDARLFPEADVHRAIKNNTDFEAPDVLPLEFTVYAHDEQNTTHLLSNADLPTGDDKLSELLYYYPGEIEIKFRLDVGAGGEYEVEPLEFVYEGTTFTPEE